tara:strand:+ start:217 stop:324 length:108 start_codon:yes stop_codon:yes gene_type:complete
VEAVAVVEQLLLALILYLQVVVVKAVKVEQVLQVA